jgi:hypothetical protein
MNFTKALEPEAAGAEKAAESPKILLARLTGKAKVFHMKWL